jgi:AcrR family transcriptional regulator
MKDSPAKATSSARDRILDAVIEVIAERGIGSVSNRRVAAVASVSLGSLTYHFPSQEQLLREALRRYVGAEIGRIELAAEGIRDRDLGPEQLGAEIERLTALAAGGPGLLAELELHLYAARDPELQEASAECFEAYERLAEAAMRALGVPEPERHRAHVVNLMMGTGLKQIGTGRHDGDGLGDALQTIAQGAIVRARVSAAAGGG